MPGTAGDLITCRPFDASLELFKKGHLAPVTDLKGMENFDSVARSGWSTDDGKTTFCVPMASVIHGFIYNKDAFDKLGIAVPKTEDEFFAALEKIKADGTYVPLALGTADQWEAATMGYQNIGPNYWQGEDGRLALIAGKEKLTDKEWVEPYQVLARWSAYMGDGYKAQTYPDSQNLLRSAEPRSIRRVRGTSRCSTSRPSSSGRVLSAGEEGGRHLLHLGPCRHRLGHERQGRASGRDQEVPGMGRSADFATIYANALPGSSACPISR